MKDTIRYPLVLFTVCAVAGLALAVTFALTYGTIDRKDKQKAEKALVGAFYNVEAPDGVSWKNFDVVPGSGPEVYAGYADAERSSLLGYAALGQARGYSSTLKVMVGLKPLEKGQYRILGIKVVAQQETPGLGTRVNDVKTNETLWTAIGSMFAAKKGEKAAPAPEVEAAAMALGAKPEAIPARPAFQAQFAGKAVAVKDGKVTGLDLKRGAVNVEGDAHAVAAMTGATVSSKAVVGAISDAILKINNALEAAALKTAAKN